MSELNFDPWNNFNCCIDCNKPAHIRDIHYQKGCKINYASCLMCHECYSIYLGRQENIIKAKDESEALLKFVCADEVNLAKRCIIKLAFHNKLGHTHLPLHLRQAIEEKHRQIYLSAWQHSMIPVFAQIIMDNENHAIGVEPSTSDYETNKLVIVDVNSNVIIKKERRSTSFENNFWNFIWDIIAYENLDYYTELPPRITSL